MTRSIEKGQILRIPGGPEVWKPVRNHEGTYEVSNHGNVRRIERSGAVREMKPRGNRYPPHYRFEVGGVTEETSVLRLMVEAFVGPLSSRLRVGIHSWGEDLQIRVLGKPPPRKRRAKRITPEVAAEALRLAKEIGVTRMTVELGISLKQWEGIRYRAKKKPGGQATGLLHEEARLHQ